MFSNLKEISDKAGSALLVLALMTAILIIQTFLSYSWQLMLVSSAFVWLLYVLWAVTSSAMEKRIAKMFPWLFTVSGARGTNSIHDIERNAHEGSTIYLITPDMHNDARNPETKLTVEKNLERHVYYVFLTVDNNPTAEHNMREVQRNFAKYDHLIDIYVANEFFSLLPTYNMLIVDNDFRGQRRVFVELPVSDDQGTASPRAFWVEADARFSDKLHEKVVAALIGLKPQVNRFVGQESISNEASSLETHT